VYWEFVGLAAQALATVSYAIRQKPTYTAEKGLAFRDKIDEMLSDRQALVDLAREHLSGL